MVDFQSNILILKLIFEKKANLSQNICDIGFLQRRFRDGICFPEAFNEVNQSPASLPDGIQDIQCIIPLRSGNETALRTSRGLPLPVNEP